MQIRIEMTKKDILRYIKKLKRISKNMETKVEKKLELMANLYLQSLRKYIEFEGQSVFHPITYRKGKILINSENYIKGIKVIETKKNHFTVGFHPADVEPKTKIYLWRLSEILEWGYENIYSRPHWAVVSRRFRKSSFYRICGDLYSEIFEV